MNTAILPYFADKYFFGKRIDDLNADL